MKLTERHNNPFRNHEFIFMGAVFLYMLSIFFFIYYYSHLIDFRKEYFSYIIFFSFNFMGFFLLLLNYNFINELKEQLLECRAVNKILESDKRNLFTKLKFKK